MDIIIRKTVHNDAEQYITLHGKVWRATYANIFAKEIFDVNDMRANERIEKFKTKKLNSSDSVDFVAVNNGQIIGFANGKTISPHGNYKNQGYADLMAIYVDPNYQHMKIGKKLFDKAVVEFKKLGCKKIVIGVLKSNTVARKAYEKWGGKLDTSYEGLFERGNLKIPEVYYIYDINC